MKRFFILLIVLILVGTSCEEKNSTTSSELYIVKKEYLDDQKKAWIVALDPNNKTKQEFRIMVKEPMVWNLIEVKKTYFATISKSSDKPWILTHIKHHGHEDALR
jgi:hypothetical protein